MSPSIDSRLRLLEKSSRREHEMVRSRFNALSEWYRRLHMVQAVQSWDQEALLDRAEREIAEERDRTLAGLEARLRLQLKGPSRLEALRQHAAALADRHDCTIILDPKMYAHGGYARLDERTATVQAAFASDTNYSVALHEIAHVINGPCDGRPNHYRNNGVGGCIACEVEAWQTAQRMALDWSEPMHRDMGAALNTYRTTTPGVMEAVDAMNAIASEDAFKSERLRRAMRDTERMESELKRGSYR